MFKSTQGLALVSAADGRIVEADAGFNSMTGRSKTTHASIMKLIRETERAAVKATLARAIAQDQELRVHVIQPGMPADEDRVAAVSLKHAPGQPGVVLWWQRILEEG